MAELVVGKYEFFPYECSKCKERTLQDLEELLRTLKDETREAVRAKARQSRRRDHNTPTADHRAFLSDGLGSAVN
ncbi:MAG: hypothetical protein KF762_15510 [Acidobacteria bacterium]|nr:hypothetical protein [Acidobacteriota bacterium]